DPARAETAHMHPDRRLARAAVVDERKRAPVWRLLAIEGVGDEENVRFGLAGGIGNRHAPGCGGVGKRLAADLDLMVGDDRRGIGAAGIERMPLGAEAAAAAALSQQWQRDESKHTGKHTTKQSARVHGKRL